MRSLVFLIMCSVFVFPATLLSADAVPVDRFAAFVNDDVIMESEIGHELIFKRARLAANSALNVKTRKEILGQIIDRKLLLTEARIRRISITTEEIDERIVKIDVANGGKTKWKEVLKRIEIESEEWRRIVTEILILEAFVDQWIRAFIQIRSAEVDRYLHDHAADFGMAADTPEFQAVLVNPEIRYTVSTLMREQAVTLKIEEKVRELREKAEIRYADQLVDKPDKESGLTVDLK